MTIFAPLDTATPQPPHPSFLRAPPNADAPAHLQKVVKALRKAKRVVVVCGAGISVQAGIPDFRSPDGLFKTLKRDNPKEVLTSGKDLFDASVFNNETTTSIFCQMIARLAELSTEATPTPFHHLMRALDDRGQLLRVYTQNIDCLEARTGLSFGVPDFEDRSTSKTKAKEGLPPTPRIADGATTLSSLVAPRPTRLPSPPAEIPRCIPLHGTLEHLHCQTCMSDAIPVAPHLPSLHAGLPPPCPECTALEATRQLIGKRARGVGRLRPSVVLYNEVHRQGEDVGRVAQQDLMGVSKSRGRKGQLGADLLVVVGTSLKVPGTKRMVREFAKAVRSRSTGAKDGETSASAPVTSSATDDDPPIKTIYLNYDFPVPTRDWEGVFDVWVQGDAQTFAELLHAEFELEEEAKRGAAERKALREADAEIKERARLRREAEEAAAALEESILRGGRNGAKGCKGKRKAGDAGLLTPPQTPKKRKTTGKAPSATPSTPSRRKGQGKHLANPKTPTKRDATSSKTTSPTSPKSASKKKPPPFTIRIPPSAASPSSPSKSPRRRLVPEVYIPTPPTYFLSRKVASGYFPSPPTSPLTPPPSSATSPASPCSSALSSPPPSPIQQPPSLGRRRSQTRGGIGGG